jgi:hypothetical protein
LRVALPTYTSIVGFLKFANRYRLSNFQAAVLVIAWCGFIINNIYFVLLQCYNVNTHTGNKNMTRHRKMASLNHPFKYFHVSVYEDKGDKDSLDFYCQAECEEGADEQALKSYPNGEIRHTIEVSPNECPIK